MLRCVKKFWWPLFQCIVLCLVVLYALYLGKKFVTSEISMQAQVVLNEEEFRGLFLRKYGRIRQLDSATLPDGTVVYVKDVLSVGNEGYLTTDEDEALRNRKNRPKCQAGCRLYYPIIVDALFQSDIIGSRNNSNILLIGLGGGTLNGYLHNVFPQMNLTVVELNQEQVYMARKWFDLVEDNNHRVEVGDGTIFLAEKARTGAVYDAILLDACSLKQLSCPAEEFLNYEVLRSIARLLHIEVFATIYPEAAAIHYEIKKIISPKKAIYLDRKLCDRPKMMENQRIWTKLGAHKHWSVAYINKLFSPKIVGLFIVNALSKTLEAAKLYQYLTNKFHMFFIYCSRLLIEGFSYQMIIYCSHRPPIPKPSIKLKSIDIVLP